MVKQTYVRIENPTLAGLMFILGIDPGTAITGYGLIKKTGNRIHVVDYGCIRTTKDLPAEKRLENIFFAVKTLLESDTRPSVVAVEQLFFNSNAKTAIAVGESRGVIMLAAALAGIELVEYTPLQVKMTMAGYGRATKEQIQYMVKTLLCLKEIPKPDDVADALALAITYAHTGDLIKKAAAAR